VENPEIKKTAPPKKTIPYERIYVNVHPETTSADFLFKDLHYKRCELIFF